MAGYLVKSDCNYSCNINRIKRKQLHFQVKDKVMQKKFCKVGCVFKNVFTDFDPYAGPIN